MTWINRHEGRGLEELSRYVDDGWSWADIGVAMQMAGISYSNGQPIAPDILRWKAYGARQREAKRASRRDQEPEAAHELKGLANSPNIGIVASPPDSTKVKMRGATPFAASDNARPQDQGEPMFKLATLIAWNSEPTLAKDIPPKTALAPPLETNVDVDAKIARLLGRK